MTKAGIGDVLALVFVLALVMLLVRPKSLAPAFIKAFGQGVDGMITYAVSG
jgi:hypothetical protein